jgi:DHA1 family bicyclomycin/chloramphenicol resistance-like MFS transporter
VNEGHAIAAAPSVPLYIPALLIGASIVSILSTDLYTPSLPHLTDVFATDAASVQRTMSLNLAGFAIAQLFYGPLADRIGRRAVLLWGMVGFLLSSMACALAPTLELLILARTLQGITAGAEAVIGFAVIRDLYEEKGAVRILGIYEMGIALAPAMGPMIGGQMHVWFGWRSNFWLLAGMIVVVIVLVGRFLPETLKRPDYGALRPTRMLLGYAALLANGRYMSYLLLLALTVAGLFAFITEAPFVYIDRLGVPTNVYGYYYAVVVLAYFLGAFGVAYVATKLAPDHLILVGLVLCALGGCALLLLFALEAETPVSLTLAAGLYGLGLGPVLAAAAVRALALANSGHGLAAALLSSIEMGGAGLGAMAVGLLHDGTSWPLGISLATVTLLALALFLAVRPWRFATAPART